MSEKERIIGKKLESQKIQGRYMKNIRGKLSPTCDQKVCPVIKERLHKHQVEHHPKNRKNSKSVDNGVPITKHDDDSIVKPIINSTIGKNGKNRNSKSTRISKTVVRKNVNIGTTYEDDDTTQTGPIPLKSSDTIEVLTPNINFYREYVRNEINNWAHNIPMYKANAKMMKDNLTNALLEDIVALAKDVQDSSYNHRLKLAIDDCLDKLPLLISDTEFDQDFVREDLSDNLFQSIKELNIKLFGSQNDNIDRISANQSTDSIDLEVTEWLKGIQIDEGSLVTKKSIADVLLDRLRPILDKPMNSTNYKLEIKSKVVGVLDDFPIHFKVAGNKFVYLNKFAEDLANRIINVQCRRKKHSVQRTVQYENHKLHDVSEICFSDSFHFRHNLTNKVKDCFETLNINNGYIVPDITNLLIDNIDLLKSGQEDIIENEISELVYDTCQFTESHSSSVASCILKSVIELIDQHLSRTTVINQQRSGIITVYTSKGPKFVTSTPKRKENKKEKNQFNTNEKDYTKKIADLVRSWIDTLPESNKELNDKNFRKIAVEDLAGNVMDTIKLSQLTKDDGKEEEHITFITNVWILKFNLFDNTDDAQHYVKDFYVKLKKIPVPDLTKPNSGSKPTAKNVDLPKERSLIHETETQQNFKDVCENECCTNMEENEDDDVNKSVKDFVTKYAQHFYDVEDSVARGAFEHLLRSTIIKNDSASRKNVYDKIEQNTTKQFLNIELMYISMVSDWLKNIPVDSTFNTLGNGKRINFINSLASELQGLDEKRNKYPDCNCENEFISLVQGYIKLLPLQENQEQNIPSMINQLHKRVLGSPVLKSVPHDDSILSESNLADFIEEYVLIRAQGIADDEVKLDAWIARLLKEIRKMAREDPNALNFTNVCQRLEGVPIPTEDPVEMFELELLCVKEISEWLRNLPLLPIRDNNDELIRIDMVSDLAEKLAQKKYTEGKLDSLKCDEELVNYITTWISKLPLNSNREVNILVVTKQLLSRIHNINNEDYATVTSASQLSAKRSLNKRNSADKNLSKPDCVKKCSLNKKKVDLKKQDLMKLNPGQMVVDAIENWCKNLSIEDEEKTVKQIKDDFAKRWFKKIGEINTDPKIYHNDELYQALLNEEIDAQLEIISTRDKSGKKNDKIKSQFLNAILEAKEIMKQKSAGEDYVQRLINTLDVSIPNQTNYQQMLDPGFEIYKNKLANLFILSNFDHYNDDYKIPYEKKIREEVDKYVTHAAARNALPLTKDQINNELYSVLFKVPIPNEESVAREVESLKTRVVIDTWYHELPLELPQNGLIELLERDKILSILAKKIHELERNEEPAEKILKEIKKWAAKFPFEVKSQCELDCYANKLLKMLVSTKEERKYIIKDTKGKGKEKKNDRDNYEPSLNARSHDESDSQTISNLTPCCQLANIEERNPTELILEMVEVWFEKLPIQANEEDIKTLKTIVVTNIVFKISELNSDYNILHDDITYYALVDQELDKVLSNLPLRCDFPTTSDYTKREFMAALQNIKPLIVDEKARFEYKNELKDTVGNVLKPPKVLNNEKLAQFNKYKEELAEEFVQYYYNKGDEEANLFYRNKIYELVLKYIQQVLNKNQDINPLMLQNKLLCELEKIPIPSKIALKHEFEEITMKKEVCAFFDKNSLTPKSKDKEHVIASLAKKLFEIERTGHTCDNEKKMKAEILKHLKKLGKGLSSDKVDAFLNRLKETEPIRKAPLPKHITSFEQPLPHQVNTTLNRMPIQNDYSSQQGVPYDVHLLASRRQSGPVNFSCSTCNNSSLKKPDQVDPCNIERFSENNQIRTSVVQEMDHFDPVDVPCCSPMVVQPQSINQSVYEDYHTSQIPPACCSSVPNAQNPSSGISRPESCTAQESNKMDVPKRPIASDVRDRRMPPGHKREPLRRKMTSNDSSEGGGVTGNRMADEVFCKCGKKHTRRIICYEYDFETCSKRPPKCNYY